MLKLFGVLFILLPLGSCSFFKFVYYPQEVQQESHGNYSIVIEESPSHFLFPSLVFGSIHNNTRLSGYLIKDGKPINGFIIVDGEDFPQDHLPLDISWHDELVTIMEPKYSKIIEVPYKETI